jgi:curved DNA-binding protein CbpA
MTEAEKLAEAYFALTLKPGSSLDAINRRFKRLVQVWHPDKFPSGSGQDEATEELKQINAAHDTLKKHFETSHSASGSCACNAYNNSSSRQSSPGPGPGPGKRRNTQETDREEADAARRSRERADRAAKAAAEAAAREAKARADAAAAAQAEAQSKQHAEETVSIESEKLRWKIAICMGVAWIVLSFSAFCLTSTKVWWTHLNEKWAQERQDKIDDENQKKAAAAAAATQAQQEQQQTEAEQKRRDAEEQERKNEAIARAKAAINEQQQIIDHCNSELAKIQPQLNDPNVADIEKIKLEGYKGQNQKWLSDAQANYNLAQNRLADATGITAPPPIGGNTDTPVPHTNSSLFSRPPVNFTNVVPSTEQPPVQKFDTPHWTPNNDPAAK